VLAAELKNNGAQMCRWICSAFLLAVDVLKIAFVSRISVRDRTRHAILGIHEIDPLEFADQMGIDMSNGFGIVKSMALRFFEGDMRGKGRTVVMRDPQKPMLRIYLTPTA
jgi:translation initiation factor 3 subunit D